MPYKDGTPTKEELAELPRWACVAFAARCARRVQPLFKALWPEAPGQHVAAVYRAITLSEQSAGRAAACDAYDALLYYAAAAAAADDALAADNSAAFAIAAAAAAADNAAAAAAAAANAAFAVASGYNAARDATLSDFESLRATAQRERWNDDTPVPPEFFGPLWPFGVPEDWPDVADQEASSEPHVLRLEFSIPPELDRDEADRLIGEIIQRTNELHHAYGGHGLTIADGKVFEYEPDLVPAGGDR